MQDYNQDIQLNDFENPKPQRPSTLSLFCVLSFINAVYQFVVGTATFLMFNVLKELFNDEEYLEMMEKYGFDLETSENAMGAIFSVSRSYFLITALLYIGSFVGVYYMWKLQKRGFHVYAIAQILILIVEVLMYANVTGASPWGSVVMTAVFIAIYYTHYKKVMQ